MKVYVLIDPVDHFSNEGTVIGVYPSLEAAHAVYSKSGHTGSWMAGDERGMWVFAQDPDNEGWTAVIEEHEVQE